MNTDTIDQLAGGEVPPWAAGTQGRDQELFPVLNATEIGLLLPYGEVQEYSKNSFVWRAGDPSAFFLILEGAIDVTRSGTDDYQVIATHTTGQYLGEINSISGANALVNGIAVEPVRVLHLDADNIRRVIATESDLGEKILLSFILRRMRLIANGFGNVALIGDSTSPDTAELHRFLSRNGVPFDALNPGKDQEAIEKRLAQCKVDTQQWPLVIADVEVLIQPSIRAVAEYLGLSSVVNCSQVFDVAIIGSGPGGMAAAVYAASEGLSVLVLESCAPGGQAGSSSKIENYMGFPTGISGQALMGRGYLQAQKFGAQIAVARKLDSLECGKALHTLRLDDHESVTARTVVIATGAVYRQPAIDGLDRFGSVHYGASHVESELCAGQEVTIIGGGNSAGQAAVYLAKRSRKVHILIRSANLTHSMSDYLIQRIERLPNITLHPNTEVKAINGDQRMQSLSIRNNQNEQTVELPTSHLFIFIGARPGTDFANRDLALDDNGFVVTGSMLSTEQLQASQWHLDRAPFPLETSYPRVFAVGDVRSGSVKRVASAVGEGSVCVQLIHQALYELEDSVAND
ncbi:MAG: FAD-dependent oxidoreductase [Pseudomonadota bacterium]